MNEDNQEQQAAQTLDQGAADNTPPPNDPPQDPPSGDEGAAQALNDAANSLTDETGGEDLPTDKKQSPTMMALLDELSGDGKPQDPPKQGKAADPAGTQSTAKPGAQENKPADPPAQAKTPDQEEAEILEGVKSERGKERIREVFSQKKQLEQDIGEFKELITSTKMSPEQFAQTLEFGRLINSGDEKDLRVALGMIEEQRSLLYSKLGVEAPGVDLLAGHDDLKQAVDNMEITRERAVELAKFRKQDQEKQAQQQAQQRSVQEHNAFQSTVNSAATAMEAYLNTRANEADHPARMQVISEHFKNPANLQNFIQTYQPNQWAATIKMMYDNIIVPKAPQAHAPQPLRSRPAVQGNPTSAGKNPIDRIASHIDNMGI